MPRDKTLSHERVEAAAREEFLTKGFENASMRSIGERAGMTPAGLYRHYKSKEDMFNALVEPAIKDMNAWYVHHKTTSYQQIEEGASKNELFSNTMIDFARDLIYPHEIEFRLLLKCAQGTKYQNIVHDIVEIEQRDMMEALEYMRSKGMRVKHISEEEMHMIMSAYTTALLEPFIHEMSHDKIEHCLSTIEDFFMPGWEKMMGY